MQFIEKSSFGLRSAVYRLQSRESNIEFVLFPMIHLGSISFFKAVQERIEECDLILFEGVDSKRARILTLAYRILARLRRMELITQNEGLDLRKLSEKTRHADISAKEFDQAWRQQSKLFRASLYFIAPVVVVYLLVFGTKQLIAGHLAVEDLQDPDEDLHADADSERLDEILLGSRDRILNDNIGELIDTASGHQKQVIAVLFGAAHMRNVIRYLYDIRGYRIVKSEWLTVFDF